MLGGGLSLEANAKLNILKVSLVPTESPVTYVNTNTAIFTGNSADYGGAVYVDDDTNSGTCASDTKTECFFQVLLLSISFLSFKFHICNTVHVFLTKPC